MHKTVKHSNEHTFVGMDENLYEVVQEDEPFLDVCPLSSQWLFILSLLSRIFQAGVPGGSG